MTSGHEDADEQRPGAREERQPRLHDRGRLHHGRGAVPPEVEAEPGHPLDGDEVQQQCRDDLVDLPPGPGQRLGPGSIPRRRQHRPGPSRSSTRARGPSQWMPMPSGRPGAHEELALRADVPDLHAQGDVYGQGGHQDRCEAAAASRPCPGARRTCRRAPSRAARMGCGRSAARITPAIRRATTTPPTRPTAACPGVTLRRRSRRNDREDEARIGGLDVAAISSVLGHRAGSSRGRP